MRPHPQDGFCVKDRGRAWLITYFNCADSIVPSIFKAIYLSRFVRYNLSTICSAIFFGLLRSDNSQLSPGGYGCPVKLPVAWLIYSQDWSKNYCTTIWFRFQNVLYIVHTHIFAIHDQKKYWGIVIFQFIRIYLLIHTIEDDTNCIISVFLFRFFLWQLSLNWLVVGCFWQDSQGTHNWSPLKLLVRF